MGSLRLVAQHQRAPRIRNAARIGDFPIRVGRNRAQQHFGIIVAGNIQHDAVGEKSRAARVG